MIEIKTILCPVDFSEHSRRALDLAVAVARWYEATLTVLHVAAAQSVTGYASGMPTIASPLLTAADRDRLVLDLRCFVESETATTALLDFVIREGDVVPEILGQAEAIGADLIILGTHGRSGFDRLMMGSVAEKMVRRARCPVLTVPREQPEVVPAGEPFRNLLCAVDFSDCSLVALEHAMSLAQRADARLTVLTVVSDVPADWRDTEVLESSSDGPDIAALLSQREARARQRLGDLVPESVRAYCDVEQVVARGTSGAAIVRTATARHCDLIVLGVHGRSTADLMLFGSTTQHVLRHAACPVMTIRPR